MLPAEKLALRKLGVRSRDLACELPAKTPARAAQASDRQRRKDEQSQYKLLCRTIVRRSKLVHAQRGSWHRPRCKAILCSYSAPLLVRVPRVLAKIDEIDQRPPKIDEIDQSHERDFRYFSGAKV